MDGLSIFLVLRETGFVDSNLALTYVVKFGSRVGQHKYDHVCHLPDAVVVLLIGSVSDSADRSLLPLIYAADGSCVWVVCCLRLA